MEGKREQLEKGQKKTTSLFVVSLAAWKQGFGIDSVRRVPVTGILVGGRKGGPASHGNSMVQLPFLIVPLWLKKALEQYEMKARETEKEVKWL